MLRKGSDLVGAGYVMYSSSTELVFAAASSGGGGGGSGVHGFTLDPSSKQYLLTRQNIRVPTRGPFYSLNEGKSNDWPPALKSYIEDMKRGTGQVAGNKMSSRYVCSLVADVHRTMLYGGWCGNPRSHLRYLFEAAPLAFLFEKAGGAASDGVSDLLDLEPNKGLHHRLPVFLGSRGDIDELRRYGDVRQVGS